VKIGTTASREAVLQTAHRKGKIAAFSGDLHRIRSLRSQRALMSRPGCRRHGSTARR
jgi:hypothetical protein